MVERNLEDVALPLWVGRGGVYVLEIRNVAPSLLHHDVVEPVYCQISGHCIAALWVLMASPLCAERAAAISGVGLQLDYGFGVVAGHLSLDHLV